ncbi:NAD(P)H-dependent oxidoreductase [Stenotrophomonas sp. 24(2023)]|uniref:NADPH-dependent FMN reductase n=1 Tax=Stenotrophomonas sp. 24(2023) TaxID=3068324 RepID=UPI0027E078F9|nr:NAD(P)H-dependent oxidoreductase [Stenotrophomonas sp. 24(2023)]WMJ69759.1 NAD(P)H-dependent oxidoreductase [Stenotrophomonas sp. 24(2023)]
MSGPTIAVLVGSLRRESCNRKLAHALEKLAAGRARFVQVEIGDLPLYTQEFDASYPVQGTRLKDQVRAADGVLFVTPEYNRSVPGVLKNAIDVGSRPYGDSAFAGKPAAVIGASIGAIGTALAQQHLRNILSYLDMRVLPQPEAFIHFKDGLIDADGTVHNEGTQAFLQGFVDRFLALVAAQGR